MSRWEMVRVGQGVHIPKDPTGVESVFRIVTRECGTLWMRFFCRVFIIGP